MRERQVDLLLGAVTRLFAEEDLEAEVLYNDRPFIVSGSNNRWARRRKVELEELLGEPWLLPGDGFFLAEAFQSQGFGVPKFGVTSYSVYQRIRIAHHRSFYWSAVWLRVAFFPSRALRAQRIACRFFRLYLASRDRQVEGSNYQSGGANLHRLHPRCREAAEGRPIVSIARKKLCKKAVYPFVSATRRKAPPNPVTSRA